MNVVISHFIQGVLNGLLISGAVTLLAIGFSLTLGITRVVNLSHPVFALSGAYIAYWLFELYHIEPLVSLGIIVPMFFLVGVAFEKYLVRKVATMAKELASASLVMTFGVTIIVENVLLYTCKATPRLVTTSYSDSSIFIRNIALQVNWIVSFVLAIVTVISIYILLHHTFLGKAARAVWQDRDGALLAGINTKRVNAFTYGISFATAGVAGTSMSLIYSIEPATHYGWLVFAFAVVILGGVGSIVGTAIAGLMIGLVIGICSALLPLAWVNIVLFGIIIILLLLKPEGLLKR
ncbi:MAG: branched-chain amino acid ABC transporter permease [Nitrososphaerota archaeon]